LAYILDTNTSDHNVGTVLSKVQHSHDMTVVYDSEAMSAQ